MREAEKQLDPIQKKLGNLEEKKTAIETGREKHAEEVRTILEAIKQNGNKVREFSYEINR